MLHDSAGLEGARLEAAAPPDWFAEALHLHPERGFVEVDGAQIETLAWGDRGKPGLMLLHGNSAHADWWSFIAPFFADTHRVGAISWSGMGRSDWRERYSIEGHVREALAGAETLGVFESSLKPVFVGHSFGGGVLMQLAASHGERLKRAVILDNGARPGGSEPMARQRTRPNAIYPTFEMALSRYRLAPAPVVAADYVTGHLAAHALREIVGPDGAKGWRWAFDPFAGASRGSDHIFRAAEMVRTSKCPLTFVRGAQSRLMSPESLAYSCALAPSGSYGLEMPAAGHHMMADHPLAFITLLRTILAAEP